MPISVNTTRLQLHAPVAIRFMHGLQRAGSHPAGAMLQVSLLPESDHRIDAGSAPGR